MKKRRLLGGTLYQLTDKAYLANHRPELLEHVPKGSEDTTTVKEIKRAKHGAKMKADTKEESCNNNDEYVKKSKGKGDVEEEKGEEKKNAETV